MNPNFNETTTTTHRQPRAKRPPLSLFSRRTPADLRAAAIARAAVLEVMG